MKDVDLLTVLARALAPLLRSELGLDQSPSLSGDWVDVAAAVPTLRRLAYRDCREGKLEARKVGRRWLSRRAKLDAWVDSHSSDDTDEDHCESSLEDMRTRLGLRLVGGK